MNERHPRDRVWTAAIGGTTVFARLVNAGATVALRLHENEEPYHFLWLDNSGERATAERVFSGISAVGDAWWEEHSRERAAIELERIRLVRAAAPVLLRRCILHDEEWDPLDPAGTGNVCPACAEGRAEIDAAARAVDDECLRVAGVIQRLNDERTPGQRHKLVARESALWSARLRELVKASDDKRAADTAIRVQPMFEDWE